MPYARPTLTTLRTQVLQDINGAQITDQNGNVLIALLTRAMLRVLGNATAGMSYEHYGYLDWIALQSVPFTATDEFLDAWANLKGVYRKVAVAATGIASFTWTSGALPIGTALTRSDGAAFVTTTAGVISGTTITADIQALTAGSAGDFDVNTVFSISNPISGINGSSSASTQVTPGTDAELDDSLRTRMLAAYAAPPQGGDKQDYIEWATSVAGVTRAWVNPNGAGAGTVVLYFMMDTAESAYGGFPQGTNGVAANETRDTAATGDQLTVADAIYAEQPVTALVYACAPTNQETNFTVTGLGTANTAANQALITAALQDMFLTNGNVGGTVDPESGSAWPSIPPSAWYAAIAAISGVPSFDVTEPSSPIAAAAGALPTLGTITFES